MSINQIRLYDLFRKELHLPDDKAAAFVIAVGDAVESGFGNNNQLLATKNDFHALKDEMHNMKIEIKDDMHNIKIDMHSIKNDMYKAMFLSGIVQLIPTLSGTLAIVKLIR